MTGRALVRGFESHPFRQARPGGGRLGGQREALLPVMVAWPTHSCVDQDSGPASQTDSYHADSQRLLIGV